MTQITQITVKGLQSPQAIEIASRTDDVFICVESQGLEPEHTVKAHVKAILLKLDAAGRTEAIAVAMKRGLLRES
jgi:hypothetical protein